ncbi:prenyltransferase/squalene oxidase repeat-containing protein [Mangrovihabitans endophyticus]|uniref:Geranylgeranyl transferase type II subunit beta n=1 Tax=Mangrovihabitans endophyticus TaxID=1751298 RepID=A0A8J3BWE6_9ACTN|nr:prenyltransferase/squalene oxidase repeat-containing protein [Mangrovihabitans endophyticus]GGK73797.1 hypothetical protein GCM10012284_04650 [Mangrovihabitans endophyticus]
MTPANPARRDHGADLPSREPDLWCTYAAIRTLTWLNRLDAVADPDGTAAYLAGRRNGDGGYAWSRGMLSDAWATFYCTQALADLGRGAVARAHTGEWVRATWSGEAYAMVPGQCPDVWATHYSCRTATEICGQQVPDRAALFAWLGRLQTKDGGLSWSPEHAATGTADTRACHYATRAWNSLRGVRSGPTPWDVPALIGWLRRQQDSTGGFRFTDTADEPCLWATYRATAALKLLGAAPDRPGDCARWMASLRGPDGGFVRWRGYPVEDVWAAFCAVGTLIALNRPVEPVATAVAGLIGRFAIAGGGYTYRSPDQAADALTTAAAILSSEPCDHRAADLREWLNECQLPNEGGAMYMPARGAEVRCTLWALAAGALREPSSARRVLHWLTTMQNPDGGVGYWQGRGSDMVSTAAAAECAGILGAPLGSVLDTTRLAAFVTSCRRGYPDGGAGFGNVPGAPPTLRAGLQAHRILAALGRCSGVGPPDTASLVRLLDRHRVPSGGHADTGARVPDLLSTYEAVVTACRYGIDADIAAPAKLMPRLRLPSGYAWTPLTAMPGGPLAACLGTLLDRYLADASTVLPAVSLS